MKQFITIKIGYTSGVYGCTGEYFTTIYTDEQGDFNTFTFKGLYGSEDRIAEVFKNKGYKQKYNNSTYGKLKKDDIARKIILSEVEALEKVKNI